jgi:hypothetical protein
MEYILSPSKLNLLEECPRCFWLATVKKISRPLGPVPSIPIKMDSIIKHYFNKYRELGELPPIVVGKVTGRLAEDMPKTLKHNVRNGIWLIGKPDDFLELEDGSIVPFDHKTASKPPEWVHSAYQLQLDVYSYLLQVNGYKTVNKAFVAFYCPDYCDLHEGMIINCTVIEVETDHVRVEKLVEKAYEVLNREMPEYGENCDFCRWKNETLNVH